MGYTTNQAVSTQQTNQPADFSRAASLLFLGLGRAFEEKLLNTLQPLIQECDELISIFVQSVKTAHSNQN